MATKKKTPAKKAPARSKAAPAVFVGGQVNLGSYAPVVGAGRVSFLSNQPRVGIVCGLGDGPATSSGGGSAWSTITRPKRTAGVEYTGIDLEQLTIPLLLDRLVESQDLPGAHVEDAIEVLEMLRRPAAGAPAGTIPPVVTIGGMVPHKGKRWIVTGLDYGDAIWRGLRRVRQELTMTLLEYQSLDLIAVPSAARKKVGGSTRIYVWKKGDTLNRVVMKELGAKGAKDIAAKVAEVKKLNKIRDPRSIKVGAKIKLPRQGKLVSGPVQFTGGVASTGGLGG